MQELSSPTGLQFPTSQLLVIGVTEVLFAVVA
jgi:hypothetical protein